MPYKLTIIHLLQGIKSCKKSIPVAFGTKTIRKDIPHPLLTNQFSLLYFEITITGPHYNRTLHESQKEDFMLEVTESATQQITEQLKGKEVTAIRIFLNEGG